MAVYQRSEIQAELHRLDQLKFELAKKKSDLYVMREIYCKTEAKMDKQ